MKALLSLNQSSNIMASTDQKVFSLGQKVFSLGQKVSISDLLHPFCKGIEKWAEMWKSGQKSTPKFPENWLSVNK